jgi:hypothetical protein
MKQRVSPWLLGMALALVLALTLATLTIIWPSFLPSWDEYKTWVDLTYYTVCFFAIMVWYAWKLHKSLKSWGVLIILFAVHVTGFALFVGHYRPLFPIHYVLIAPFEAILVGFFVERAANRKQKSSKAS